MQQKMAAAPLKILVSGDVEGNFTQLFRRVRSVNDKNGPFQMLLCIGDFFGSNDKEWQKYLDGTLKVPISTYILGPHLAENKKYYSDSNGQELCNNVTYLGQKGMFTSASGLKIIYVSGQESYEKKSGDINFTFEDIKTVQMPLITQSQFKGIDILLTSQWPQGVTKYAVCPYLQEGFTINMGSKSLAQLAHALKPRYHFSAIEGIHYERLPYRNHKVLLESAKHVTRFIALAKVDNAQKHKWLYAFNIMPLSSMEQSELIKQPQDVTECPYEFDSSSLSQDEDKKNIQYFFSIPKPDDNERKKRKQRDYEQIPAKKAQTPRPSPGSCWFCLGSPQVEKHLVVSIGTNIYLTIAKGALVPDHILILPIGHYQSTVELPADSIEEIEHYKSALQKYYKSKDKTAIFFERNYKTQHLQIQVVPVSATVPNAVMKEYFLDIADSQNIILDEIPKHSELSQIVPPGCPYFFAELPNGQKFLHRIRGKFPLQFGREVLACPRLLNMPDRADWKACILSKEEEGAMAKEFKSSFEPFDFTL